MSSPTLMHFCCDAAKLISEVCLHVDRSHPDSISTYILPSADGVVCAGTDFFLQQFPFVSYVETEMTFI